MAFLFLRSLEASKARRYKWGACCGTNWRCTACTFQTRCTGWGFLINPTFMLPENPRRIFQRFRSLPESPSSRKVRTARAFSSFLALRKPSEQPIEPPQNPTEPRRPQQIHPRDAPRRRLHRKSPSEKEGPAPRIVTLWKLTRLAQFLPKWEGVQSKRRSTPTRRPLKTTVHMTTTLFFRRRPSGDVLSLHLFVQKSPETAESLRMSDHL